MATKNALRWVFAIFLWFVHCSVGHASFCEPFDLQPQHCVGIMREALIWTSPEKGGTQESFEAYMSNPTPLGGLSLLETAQLLPTSCSATYLQLICFTVFRPCTDNMKPSRVCRESCLVCFFDLFLLTSQ